MPRKKRNPPFLMLPQAIYDSEEFASLSPAAVRVLLVLIRAHNGTNNGALPCGQAYLGKSAGMSSKTISAAVKALVEVGFVVITRPGSERRSRLAALRWHPPGPGLPADVIARDWQLWGPGQYYEHEQRPVRVSGWQRQYAKQAVQSNG